MLRLLVPEDIDLPSYGQLNIGNDAWKVINGDRWVQDGKKYICISYAWGNKKVPNTLYGGANIMSSRTMDVLNVALRTLKGQELLAIYLDAFCLPPRGDPSRSEGIDEMSHVYNSASQVIVVLSKDSAPFLRLAKVGIRGRATMEHTPALELLEKDSWVTRVWTYQEMANCRGPGWLFVAEGDEEGTTVNGVTLMNALGNVKSAYKRAHKFPNGTIQRPDSEVAVRLRFPNVNLLEDLLLDCSIQAPLQRSALQIMANVNRRIRERDEDYFNAMIGAIVRPSESKAIRISWKSIKESPAVHELVNLHPSATQNPDEALKHILNPIKIAFAANQFMQVCEAKGDYSFIFTTAQRSKRFGQRWKPVPEHFHPITSLHSSGSKQPGLIQNGQLHLHDMVPQKIAPLTDDGAEFLMSWIRTLVPGPSHSLPLTSLRRCLQDNGFVSDVPDPVITQYGYFFPQMEWTASQDEIELFISSSIAWVCGAPGVLVKRLRSAAGGYEFLSVGIFVGDIFAADAMSKKRTIILGEEAQAATA